MHPAGAETGPLLTGSHEGLEQRVAAALSARLAGSAAYDQEEIERVSTLDRRLFPKGFVLDAEASERFRALCLLSRSTLPSPDRIRSHRKYIGPVIVQFKRLCWKILSSQLREPFDAMAEFNSWVVYSQAKQHVEVRTRSAL